MRTGRLTQRVKCERQSKTQDAIGQPVDTWTELFSRRASIEPLSGRELLQASGEHSDTTVKIRMRWDSTVARIRPYDRIKDESHSPVVVYDVTSVINPREKDWEIELLCRRQLFA